MTVSGYRGSARPLDQAANAGDRTCRTVLENISLEQGQIQGRQTLGRDHRYATEGAILNAVNFARSTCTDSQL